MGLSALEITRLMARRGVGGLRLLFELRNRRLTVWRRRRPTRQDDVSLARVAVIASLTSPLSAGVAREAGPIRSAIPGRPSQAARCPAALLRNPQNRRVRGTPARVTHRSARGQGRARSRLSSTSGRAPTAPRFFGVRRCGRDGSASNTEPHERPFTMNRFLTSLRGLCARWPPCNSRCDAQTQTDPSRLGIGPANDRPRNKRKTRGRVFHDARMPCRAPEPARV